MREAVTISYGSHLLPSPLLDDLNTLIYVFALFFQLLLFGEYLLEPIWAMVTRPVQGP